MGGILTVKALRSRKNSVFSFPFEGDQDNVNGWMDGSFSCGSFFNFGRVIICVCCLALFV